MKENHIESVLSDNQLAPKPFETPDQYLGRMFVGEKTDKNIVHLVFENLKQLEKTAYPIPLEVQEKELEIFEDSQRSLEFSAKIRQTESKMEMFSLTARTRSFAGPLDSLSKSLFKVYDPKNEDAKQYLKEHIDNKTIYLFGGGDSVNDLLRNNDFNPELVMNIDPYLTKEYIHKNENKNYQSISLPVESEEFADKIKSGEIPQADEIWASFSVPMYLESAEQIFGMFKNLDLCLKPGGMARITPLYLHVYGETLTDSDFKEDITEKRWWAFSKSLRDLVESGKYNFSISEDTLFIKKV